MSETSRAVIVRNGWKRQITAITNNICSELIKVMSFHLPTAMKSIGYKYLCIRILFIQAILSNTWLHLSYCLNYQNALSLILHIGYSASTCVSSLLRVSYCFFFFYSNKFIEGGVSLIWEEREASLICEKRVRYPSFEK